MESRYGIGINNRYALFIDQDDVEDEAILKKAAEAAKKAKEVQLKETPATTATPTTAKKETKTPAAGVGPQQQANNTAKKIEAGKPPRSEDKENRNNRFEGKRVLDARKAQEGPQEARTREDRNNRRNRPANDDEANQNIPARTGHETQGQRNGEARRGGRGGRGTNGGQVGERRGDRDRGDRGERVDRAERGERRERREGRDDREGREVRGGGRGGKRDFDRKSGDDRTGVKAVDKREGGGPHNWGTFNDEIKGDEDKANVTTEEVTETNGEAGQSSSDENKSDEPKVMTLDEWKKQQGERSGPTFNLRKAGEGSEIDPKWKKTYAYKKEKESHEDDDDEDHELYPQRVNRQRHLMDIEINFGDANRGGGGTGGGRGGRGGPRGGRDRPRGERRGGRGGPGGSGQSTGKPRGRNAEAPNVNDEQSFPSLG